MTDWPITWRACWIWAESPVPIVSPFAAGHRPPRETWNRFCYLRRSFHLDTVPDRAAARVTADSRFILYVNGAEVARGPARSMPERLAYAEIDLSSWLRAGTNVLAALVRFYGAAVPWWQPARPSYQLGYGSFAFESPAIGIVSDASWKGRAAPYQPDVSSARALPVPPIELLDGAEVPPGWMEPGFDDSEWKPSAELSAGTFAANRKRIPVEPYTAPELADLAPLTAIPIALAELSSHVVPDNHDQDPRAAYPPADQSVGPADGADLITTFDAGRITLATPWVEAHGPRGSTVDLYVGEDLRADRSAEISPRFYATRYQLAGAGRERAEGFDAVGFRYLTIVARGGARVDHAGAIERRYPRSDAAHFASDDERLNTLWRIGARTLDLCSTDAFIDCPFREQRAWLGDAYVHSLLTYVTATDWRLARRNLRIFAQSQRADGLLAMVAVGDFSNVSTTIPDFSLHWVRALARYFEHSGDSDTARELLPVGLDVLAAFERFRAADGLIRGMPGWLFVDWAMTERAEVVGAIDALYAAALEDFAALSAALGDASPAADARRRAARTREAFEALWDDQRGIYVDAADDHGPRRRVSQQTNAAAIVSGCAPPSRWARILDYILDPRRLVVTPTISDNRSAYISQRMNPSDYMEFDPERNVVAAQPFFSHLLHQAVVAAGRRDLIAELCMRWWPQVERGNTCFEEYWSGPSGDASRCHAWAGTPTYDLTTHLLGVRPAAAGYRRAEIRPLFGALKRLQGRVPTPHGLIEVDLDRERGGLVTIPPGVTADLHFDDAPLADRSLGPGRHEISR
jgi:alpha-L-rhamnosidase